MGGCEGSTPHARLRMAVLGDGSKGSERWGWVLPVMGASLGGIEDVSGTRFSSAEEQST